jgi:hypothetical protein
LRSSTTRNHDTRRTSNFWIESSAGNIGRANAALSEFGSPYSLDDNKPDEIPQLGVAPNRIVLLRAVSGVTFPTAWKKRIRGRYGHAKANWMDLDCLIRIKSRIKRPRHQEDARVLREIRKRNRK